MTRQNRVLPTGEIVADPGRGTLMGNRGILHGGDGRLGVARWKHPHWICCRLAFKGRRRAVMAPGTYTELFFLDEAVALAAGHRPCAECRREAFETFRAAWEAALRARLSAPEIDRALHAARVRRDRSQVRHAAAAGSLPDGAFVLIGDAPHLILGGRALPFSHAGYGLGREVDGEAVLTVLTPALTVAVLRAGYRPELHASVTG